MLLSVPPLNEYLAKFLKFNFFSKNNASLHKIVKRLRRRNVIGKNIENTNQPIGKLQCYAAMYFLPLSRNDRTFCDNMGSNEVGPYSN